MTINHLCVDAVEIAYTDEGTAARCDGWATTAWTPRRRGSRRSPLNGLDRRYVGERG